MNQPESEPLPSAADRLTLQTTADREARLLAPYALFSVHTRGRRYPEPEHPYRGPFQRDRDRILHSAAFRRLSGKTQVFTGEKGDYHRTRLTHTHEVSSIARTIGRALRLNEDLIEALALYHDLGHPPFGHAGEDALDECLADQGGFSHNQYALTIAEELEQRYAPFPGLNLSFEVLESQQTRVDKQAENSCPLLEAQVVDAADSIAYNAHDVDDAIKLGWLTLDDLRTVRLGAEMLSRVRDRSGAPGGRPEDAAADALRRAVVHELIDVQVGNVLDACRERLQRDQWPSADAARRADWRVGPSADFAVRKQELEAFLYDRVYRHPRLVAVRQQAQARLRRLFEWLVKHPEYLPDRFPPRREKVGIARAAAEHLAGMTDRYFAEQYQQLIGGNA